MAEADLWERRRQCTTRAHEFANYIETQINSQTTEIGMWQTHYNARTERCYVLIDEYNTSGPASGVGAAPYSSQRLWDAFEQRLIARYASGVTGDDQRLWCIQTSEDDKRETSSPGCTSVGEFIGRLMRE